MVIGQHYRGTGNVVVGDEVIRTTIEAGFAAFGVEEEIFFVASGYYRYIMTTGFAQEEQIVGRGELQPRWLYIRIFRGNEVIGLAGMYGHDLVTGEMIFTDAINNGGICVTRLLQDEEGGSFVGVR